MSKYVAVASVKDEGRKLLYTFLKKLQTQRIVHCKLSSVRETTVTPTKTNDLKYFQLISHDPIMDYMACPALLNLAFYFLSFFYGGKGCRHARERRKEAVWHTQFGQMSSVKSCYMSLKVKLVLAPCLALLVEGKVSRNELVAPVKRLIS